jgi:hypothetical protein
MWLKWQSAILAKKSIFNCKKKEPGMMSAHTCDPSRRQEDLQLEASQGYTVSPCLQKEAKDSNTQDSFFFAYDPV